jgi:hypothetical protein
VAAVSMSLTGGGTATISAWATSRPLRICSRWRVIQPGVTSRACGSGASSSRSSPVKLRRPVPSMRVSIHAQPFRRRRLKHPSNDRLTIARHRACGTTALRLPDRVLPCCRPDRDGLASLHLGRCSRSPCTGSAAPYR